jgi:hypothetical protein
MEALTFADEPIAGDPKASRQIVELSTLERHELAAGLVDGPRLARALFAAADRGDHLADVLDAWLGSLGPLTNAQQGMAFDALAQFITERGEPFPGVMNLLGSLFDEDEAA